MNKSRSLDWGREKQMSNYEHGYARIPATVGNGQKLGVRPQTSQQPNQQATQPERVALQTKAHETKQESQRQEEPLQNQKCNEEKVRRRASQNLSKSWNDFLVVGHQVRNMNPDYPR
jgi:hypothetical protein